MQSTAPNYKYLEAAMASNKLKYQELRAPISTLDGNMIVANNKYMAVSSAFHLLLLIFFYHTIDGLAIWRWI